MTLTVWVTSTNNQSIDQVALSQKLLPTKYTLFSSAEVYKCVPYKNQKDLIDAAESFYVHIMSSRSMKQYLVM